MKYLKLFEDFENLETKQQIIEEIEKIQNKIKAQSLMASMIPSKNKLEMISSWKNKIKDLQDKLQLFENFESEEEFGDRKTEFGTFVNPEGDEYYEDGDDEEYDPYSYNGCGCCPVCTGERDCECGCPECNYPEELDKLEESKKSGVTASLKKKSKASGIPMGILRKVFSKGMQAWNAGHRPGVAQHQWAFGRVNSFITGAGGARKADADLWSKAKAAKARKKKK
jgi:hypothetical protein